MQFQFIALTYADGTVGRMQFLTRCRLGQIPLDAVLPGEFAIDLNAQEWVREPTPSNMAWELRDQPNVVSWRVVPDGDPFAGLDHRWGKAWRDSGNAVSVNLVEARKIRRDELKAERDRLLKEAAELEPLAEAAGAVTTAYVASENAKDLQALDDAAIQASVDGVNDLATLETHEPVAIANAKSGAVPTSQELAAALRTLAIAGVDRLDALGRQLRAEAELTRKALNRVQARVDQLVAGIVAQSTYANLRTAAGNLVALGAYTKAEVIQLFKDEITADA